MKRRVHFSGKEKIIIFLLMIMTAFAAVMIFKGIPMVYRANQAIKESVEMTEAFLQEPQELFREEEKSTGVEGETVSEKGDAILSVTSSEEHNFALYDGLTSHHLWLGVARVMESAQPGEKGNCIVYGHRDSAFRCLKDVEEGDKVTITTSRYEATYIVDEMKICLPEGKEITQLYDSAHLTLVTCYPFIYSGPSPKRYLVICKLDSLKKLPFELRSQK